MLTYLAFTYTTYRYSTEESGHSKTFFFLSSLYFKLRANVFKQELLCEKNPDMLFSQRTIWVNVARSAQLLKEGSGSTSTSSSVNWTILILLETIFFFKGDWNS